MKTFTKVVMAEIEGGEKKGRTSRPEENSRAIHGTVYTKIQIMQLFCIV